MWRENPSITEWKQKKHRRILVNVTLIERRLSVSFRGTFIIEVGRKMKKGISHWILKVGENIESTIEQIWSSNLSFWNSEKLELSCNK